jgi:hypothetical protein
MRPVVGIHVIYELAAAFLSPANVSVGKALLGFVRDLDPSYAPPTWSLLSSEVLKLRTNAAVLPFLDHLNQASTRAEVYRLAGGDLGGQAQAFITGREKEIEREHPAAMQEYIDHVRRVRARRGSLPPLRSFEDVAEYFRDQWPNMIRELLRQQVSASEARELASRLGEFPAIRAALNANLYLMFICIAREVVPGGDKLDDYRHLIDATYSHTLVLYDVKAKRAVPHIAPHLRTLSWEDMDGRAG